MHCATEYCEHFDDAEWKKNMRIEKEISAGLHRVLYEGSRTFPTLLHCRVPKDTVSNGSTCIVGFIFTNALDGRTLKNRPPNGRGCFVFVIADFAKD